MLRRLVAGLAQSVFGKELGFDASLARSNTQLHEQSPAHFANRPRQ